MRVAVLPGYSRYEVLETGVARYRESVKIYPDYDDGKDGYRKIKLYQDGLKKRKSFWVSRLVYKAFNGPIPPNMQIDHFDGHRVNNNRENLMLVMPKQNAVLKKQGDSRYLFNRKGKKKEKKA